MPHLRETEDEDPVRFEAVRDKLQYAVAERRGVTLTREDCEVILIGLRSIAILLADFEIVRDLLDT